MAFALKHTILIVVALAITLMMTFLSPTSAIPDQCNNILYSGESLNSGQSLVHGSYAFIMQQDCNAVLYESGTAKWATNTGGLGSNCYISMQRDGNLVLYDSGSKALWASGTARGQGNYVCVLQRDRNLVIYGSSLWATGTHTYGTGVEVNLINNETMDNVVASQDENTVTNN